MAGRREKSSGDGGALRRAKALSAPSRVQMMARLRASPVPLTAGDLAEQMGLHHTVVRDHLALLVEAGLVRGELLPVVGRGRPRTGYVAVEAAPEDAYRALASLLAEALVSGESARAVGRRAGGAITPLAAGAVATVHREAERLGFQPALRMRGEVHEIVLHECPFVEVALERPETVCDLHLGLAEGVCERAGGAVVDGLHIADPRAGGCRISLRLTT